MKGRKNLYYQYLLGGNYIVTIYVFIGRNTIFISATKEKEIHE